VLLSSSATAARIYLDVTFSLTDSGLTWVTQLNTDPRAAYDALLRCFGRRTRSLEATFDRFPEAWLSPLHNGEEIPRPHTREHYVDFLVARVSNVVRTGNIGWSASEPLIREAIIRYTETILEGARSRQRPDPFSRNQDFVHTCEEALVKFASSRCGSEHDWR
jgi:hypothetical protein